MTTQQAAKSGHLIAFSWQAGGEGQSRQWVVRQGDYAGALGATRHDAFCGAFGVRRSTPLECERLQGFPDNWTEGLSDSARYRALGNAVCVPVAKWIAKRIIAIE